MKFSTISAILSAALASSRTVSVPDRVEDIQDVSIADVFGDKIPGKSPLTFCKGDRSKDAIKITQVDLVPNPPARGQNLIVSAAATVNEAVQKGAILEVKVKFLASTVYHKKFDICEELQKLGQDCPLDVGNIFVNETYPIPKKGYPHGAYSFTANAKFQDGRPITCIEGRIKL